MSNVDLMYEEYPFLKKYIKRKHVSEGKVGRWTDEFLKTIRISERHYARLLLLDNQGKKVTSLDRFFWWLAGAGGESVEQALARIGGKRAGRITQALYIKPDRGGSAITLLKVPRPYENAEEWRLALIEKTRAQFEEEKI